MGRNPKPDSLCNPKYAKYDKARGNALPRLTEGLVYSSDASTEPADVFNELVAYMSAMGIIGDVDQFLLRMLADAICEYRIARSEMQKAGYDYEGAKGSILEHPAVKRCQRWAKTVYEMGAKFGMTPADRRAIAIMTPVDPDGADRFKGKL